MLIRVRLYLVMYNIHSIPVRLSQYSIPETRNVEEMFYASKPAIHRGRGVEACLWRMVTH